MINTDGIQVFHIMGLDIVFERVNIILLLWAQFVSSLWVLKVFEGFCSALIFTISVRWIDEQN